jgi:RNase P subunit RPR2
MFKLWGFWRKPEPTKAFCMKCKAMHDMRNSTTARFKNGRNALKGFCSVCGTKMTRMLPAKTIA